MGIVRSLSAAEQHNLIAIANNAVSRCAYLFAEKCGNKRFFSRQDIEDIAGTVILKAWRSLDSYNPEKASIKCWVTRIALNCVKDAVDYRMRRLSISASLYNDREEDECFDASEVCDVKRGFNTDVQEMFSSYEADRDINRREFEQCVSNEVSKLSDKNQRFYRMLKDGYAPREMAALEGCTPNAASKRIFDIRHSLKAAIAQVADEFGIPCEKIAG